MGVDQHRGVGTRDDGTPTGISVAVGAVLVVGAALLAALLFPPDELPGRALVVAIALGGFARFVPDLRAVGAVTVLGAMTFVGFLANEFGELVGAPASAWAYPAGFGFAAGLGAGYRRLRTYAAAPGPSPAPAPTASARTAQARAVQAPTAPARPFPPTVTPSDGEPGRRQAA
ncbi:hypothetical protein ACFOOK_23995 [Micromonospora krabiensis]|uniref:Uncharacterized protein n=1 Tax=Micromonospora krabiensis TaxID=307121 RepID=A0A1C3N728_9ACTN|nr:hypothetical protein [Micromonospora krabiensis]SBV28370.1 hypothetical protein GA0070620_3913 [Micromonospora krabiensis]